MIDKDEIEKALNKAFESGKKNFEIDIPLAGPAKKNQVIDLEENKDYQVADQNQNREPDSPNQSSLPAVKSTSEKDSSPQKQREPEEARVDFSSPLESDYMYPGFGVFPPKAMKNRIAYNNLFTNLHRSEKNRQKAGEEIYHNQQMFSIQENLKNTAIKPLPKYPYNTESFPLNSFPEKARDFIISVTEYLQVPIEAVGTALLGAMAISARGNYRIEVREEFELPLTEWFVVVLPSGKRKSPIIRIFREPFENVEAEMQIECDSKLKVNKLKGKFLSKYKLKKENIAIKGIIEADISPEHIPVIADRFAKELEPVETALNQVNHRPRFLINMATPKEVAMAMSRQGEAIGILESEGGLLKNSLRPNNDIFLVSYDMDPFSDETATSDSVVMKSPCIAMCIFMQPKVAAKLYVKENLKDEGFLPRILVVFPPPAEPKARTLFNKEAKEWYYEKIISNLRIKRPSGRKGERTLYTIKLTPEALNEIEKFESEIISRFEEGEFEQIEEFAEKLLGHAIRLAGLVHMLEYDEPHQYPIDVKSIRAGIDLANFFTNHVKSAFDQEKIIGLEFAKKILKWIADRDNPENRLLGFTANIARREIGHCDIDKILKGLSILENHGYVATYRVGRTTYCFVNPRFLNDI